MQKRTDLRSVLRFRLLDADALEHVGGGFRPPAVPSPNASDPRAWPREARSGIFESVIGERERLAAGAEGEWRQAEELMTRSEREYAAGDYMSGTGIGDADAMYRQGWASERFADEHARTAVSAWESSEGRAPVLSEGETEDIVVPGNSFDPEL